MRMDLCAHTCRCAVFKCRCMYVTEGGGIDQFGCTITQNQFVCKTKRSVQMKTVVFTILSKGLSTRKTVSI